MGRITRTNFGCTAKRTLTAAELIAAFAAGNVATIEMVPARAAVYHVPLYGAIRIQWNADFGNIDGSAKAGLAVGTAVFTDPENVTPSFATASDIFAAGGSCLTMLETAILADAGIPVLPIADYANKPVNFILDNVAAGPFTLGGISTVELTCFYLAL
jgi:hypothetical protein